MRGSNAPSRRERIRRVEIDNGIVSTSRICSPCSGDEAEEMVAKLRHLRRARTAQRVQSRRRKLHDLQGKKRVVGGCRAQQFDQGCHAAC
jgi:hypothetical protein